MKHSAITAAFLIAVLAGCRTTDAQDNSRNSLDWDGVYSGIIPCADCEGIKTDIELNPAGTFRMAQHYLGRSDSLYYTEGSFRWNEAGSAITLIIDGNEPVHHQYLVGENRLFKLDAEGNSITGDLAVNYILRKAGTAQQISGRLWKLVEIGGNSVNHGDSGGKEAHMILWPTGNRVSGNGGCNAFTGTYELKEGNRLLFSPLATTRMFCPDMDTEDQLLKVFEATDNYTLNGDTLSLNKARMAPLARFRAVYFE